MSEFDGATYSAPQDEVRLARQLDRLYELMKDGAWRTLAEIQAATGIHEQSASARLRDFRKDRFGGFVVERRRRGDPKLGLFEYRVIVPVMTKPIAGQTSLVTGLKA